MIVKIWYTQSAGTRQKWLGQDFFMKGRDKPCVLMIIPEVGLSNFS